MSGPGGAALSSLYARLGPHLTPFAILLGIVSASTLQTESASYLHLSLDYNKPYFTFFTTHISFTLVFPLHLVLLKLTTPTPTATHLSALRHVIAAQLGTEAILHPWIRQVTWMTILISIPALSWFVAMTFSNPMDITSIYATSSFHVYFFSMLMLGTPLSRWTLGSIALAFAGVVVIALGGKGESDAAQGDRRVLGDGIMLFGAIVLGLYEVIYKLALPESQGGVTKTSPSAGEYRALPIHASPPDTPPYTSDISIPLSPTLRPLSPTSRRADSPPLPTSRLLQPAHPPSQTQLPPALHANFLTSSIGLATLLLLWIPIVFLDIQGWERFEWPAGDWRVWCCMGLVAAGGSLYNAGLMVLIGIWGPTISSVANLLTIGLVALIDALWLGNVPSLETVLGVGMICVGFGVLLWEGEG
ncbi:hypothetical protein P7C73_g4138, partial [Tremellales sp. Uapishka_1]